MLVRPGRQGRSPTEWCASADQRYLPRFTTAGIFGYNGASVGSTLGLVMVVIAAVESSPADGSRGLPKLWNPIGSVVRRQQMDLRFDTWVNASWLARFTTTRSSYTPAMDCLSSAGRPSIRWRTEFLHRQGKLTIMLHSTKTRSRGIGVLDLLIGLGVLLVVLAFASPSLSRATAKAELRAAVENMELSVRMARSTARHLETDVIMHLETDPADKQCSVTFSVPQENAKSGSAALLQDYVFPPDVRLESNAPSVHFDKQGMVESTTLLLLVSNQDEDLSERLVIE